MFGGARDDTFDGGLGDDVMRGGAGNDSYRFSGAWGKDVIGDSDGLGSIWIDGQQVVDVKLAGSSTAWTAKLSDGQVLSLVAVQDKTSSTGMKLVIARDGVAANTITLDGFDFLKAQSAQGYLGIKLATNLAVAIQANGVDRTGPAVAAGVTDVAANPFQSAGFSLEALEGSSTAGSTKSFTIYFNQALQSGSSFVLQLGDLGAAQLTAVYGNLSMPANGATFQLPAGATQATFALRKSDASNIETDIAGLVSVVVTSGANVANSNSWALTWSSHGDPGATIFGDESPTTNKDLLSGTPNADRILGLTEDDALLGLGGADKLEGDAGGDVLMGGLGADTLKGGPGDDLIYGSSNGGFSGTSVTVDPSDVIAQGQNWVYYRNGIVDQDGFAAASLAGLSRDLQTGDAGNAIEGGDGDDLIYAGSGDDLVEGGNGSDDIDGMGGSDVLWAMPETTASRAMAATSMA
ncbi:MAG: hypothetical protein H7255_11270 [Ramlibacter sp.]|nr:hypothetical protein [Ramlibacter sp.]